jgi:hypothetical protein
VCATAFFDIKIAFDSAWHPAPAILAGLAGRGCPGFLPKMINSFLSNRQACFEINDHTLTKNVNLGREDSVSFLVENSHRRSAKNFLAELLTLMVTLTTSSEPPPIKIQVLPHKTFRLSVTRLEHGFPRGNFFSMQLKPCSFYSPVRHCLFTHLSVVINSVIISPSLSASFLGLTLDGNLKWVNHVQAKRTSAKR